MIVSQLRLLVRFGSVSCAMTVFHAGLSLQQAAARGRLADRFVQRRGNARAGSATRLADR